MKNKIFKVCLFFLISFFEVGLLQSQSFDSNRNIDNYINNTANNDLLNKHNRRLNTIENNLKKVWGRFETDFREFKLNLDKISKSVESETISTQDFKSLKGEIANLSDKIDILDQRIKRTFELSNDVEFRVMRLEKRMKTILSLVDDDLSKRIVDQDLLETSEIPKSKMSSNDGNQGTVWQIETRELNKQLNKNKSPILESDLEKSKNTINNQDPNLTGPISLTEMVSDENKNNNNDNKLKLDNENKVASKPLNSPITLPDANEEIQYKFALNLAMQNDYVTAEKAFLEFKTLNPNHPRTSDAVFWLGRIQFAQGEFEKSAVTFAEFNSMFSNDSRIPETVLLMAESVSKFASPEQVCEVYQSIPTFVQKPTEKFKIRLQELSKISNCNLNNAN